MGAESFSRSAIAPDIDRLLFASSGDRSENNI